MCVCVCTCALVHVCACVQEDLRFLYEALLSQLGRVPSDTNGSVAVWSGPAPSLESLD